MTEPIDGRLSALERAVGELRELVAEHEREGTPQLARVEQVQLRILRIVEGDQEIGFRGLRADVSALRERVVLSEQAVARIEAEREVERATLRGVRATWGVVASATAVNLLTNLGQVLGLMGPR